MSTDRQAKLLLRLTMLKIPRSRMVSFERISPFHSVQACYPVDDTATRTLLSGEVSDDVDRLTQAALSRRCSTSALSTVRYPSIDTYSFSYAPFR